MKRDFNRKRTRYSTPQPEAAVVDADRDSPELEAELLKVLESSFTSYSSEEMRAECEQIVRGNRT